MKVSLVGQGYLGTAYGKVYKDAVLYDPYKLGDESATKEQVNECDVAIVAVPTDPTPGGSLDMSIVEEVVSWLETPLIIIKSALMPGTVERLAEKYNKRIAVSVEYIGMGNYYLDPHDYPDPLDPQKHKLLVVGGSNRHVAQEAAEFLWQKMSPDTRIHIVTGREAEITKLIENFYGAYKVTFANCLYDLVEAAGELPLAVHQAWSEDGRVDPMHTRVVKGKRGWSSHCYNKDVEALAAYARAVGAPDMEKLVDTIVELNERHKALNA